MQTQILKKSPRDRRFRKRVRRWRRRPSLSGFNIICYMTFTLLITLMGLGQIHVRHAILDMRNQTQQCRDISVEEEKIKLSLETETAAQNNSTVVLDSAIQQGLISPMKENVIEAYVSSREMLRYESGYQQAFKESFEPANGPMRLPQLLQHVADWTESVYAAGHPTEEGTLPKE